MNELQILELIKKDAWMMRVLTTAESLNLPDWLIGAGFVRNKVWDHLHGYTKNTPPTDIDLVYFDNENKFNEIEMESELSNLMPGLKWEVKNQATRHTKNEDDPYTSTADAISKWPETATAVGVKIENGDLRLIAPLGIEDLVTMVARPTPTFMTSEKKKARIRERITQKKWLKKWPKLQIVIE